MKLKTKEELEKELAILKEADKSVKTLEVFLDSDDDDMIATIFVSKPDKSVRKMVNTLLNKDNYEGAAKACLRKLYVGGDNLDEIFENDYAMESAGMGVVEILKVQKAVLKKN
jgi:hypothetical protein